MDELSEEMLKIVDLIKAGEVDLVEQLLEGNPELYSNYTNDDLTIIYLKLFPWNDPVGDWLERNISISSWLGYWAQFIKDHPNYIKDRLE